MGQARAIWLVTPRLRLRPLCADDGAGVLAGLNDPSIASWLATTPFPYPAEELHRYIATAPMGETFAIHDDQGFAGLIGAGAELGFWIASRAQGQGYAFEAALHLLRAVFEFWLGDMRAGYFAGNVASARVLGKLGFQKTGQGPRYCRPLGQAMDHVDMILPRDRFLELHGLSPRA